MRQRSSVDGPNARNRQAAVPEQGFAGLLGMPCSLLTGFIIDCSAALCGLLLGPHDLAQYLDSKVLRRGY